MSHIFTAIIKTVDGNNDNDVYHELVITSKDLHTWPDLFRVFDQAIKGAGFYPNREIYEDILAEIYPEKGDEVCEHSAECFDCCHNRNNYDQ